MTSKFIFVNQVFTDFFLIGYSQKILGTIKYKFLIVLIFINYKNLNFSYLAKDLYIIFHKIRNILNIMMEVNILY